MSSESRADTLNTRPLWDQRGNQNLLFLPLLLSGWVSSNDTVPIRPSAQLDPTEVKTEAQGQKVALSVAQQPGAESGGHSNLPPIPCTS